MSKVISSGLTTTSLFTIVKAIFTALPFIFFLTYVHVSSKKIQTLQQNLNIVNNHPSDFNKSLKVVYRDTAFQKASDTNQLSTLREQNASLKSQLTKLINTGNLKKEVLQQINDLRNQNNDLQTQNSGLQEQENKCELLDKQLSDKQNTFQQLQINLNQCTAKNEQLSSQLTNQTTASQNNIQQLTTQLANCKNTSQTIQTRLNQCTAKNNQLASQVNSNNTTTTMSQTTIKQLTNCQNISQQIQTQLNQCKIKNNNLQKKIIKIYKPAPTTPIQ